MGAGTVRPVGLQGYTIVGGGGDETYLKSADWDMCEMEKKNRQTDSTANTN